MTDDRLSANAFTDDTATLCDVQAIPNLASKKRMLRFEGEGTTAISVVARQHIDTNSMTVPAVCELGMEQDFVMAS